MKFILRFWVELLVVFKGVCRELKLHTSQTALRLISTLVSSLGLCSFSKKITIWFKCWFGCREGSISPHQHFQRRLLGCFALDRRLSVIQRLKETEQTGSLTDSAEFDTERLHLDEQVLHVDDLVPYQRLEEHAHQAH